MNFRSCLRPCLRRLPASLLLASSFLLPGCKSKNAEEKASEKVSEDASENSSKSQDNSKSAADAAPPKDKVAYGNEAVIALARFSQSEKLANTLFEGLTIEGKDFDWKKKLDEANPKIRTILDLSAPLDIGLLLPSLATSSNNTPSPSAVFSIGLASKKEALEFLKEDGSTISEEKGHTIVRDERLLCRVEDIADKTDKARAYCRMLPKSDTNQDPDSGANKEGAKATPPETKLFPAAPNSEAPGLHVYAYPEAIRQMAGAKLNSFRPMIGIGVMGALADLPDEELKTGLTTAITGITNELYAILEDLDAVNMHLQSDAKSGQLSGDISVDFRSYTSFWAQQMKRESAAAGPAPAHFWKLPTSLDGARYTQLVPAPESPKIRETLSQLIRGGFRLIPGTEAKKEQLLTSLLATFGAHKGHMLSGTRSSSLSQSKHPLAADNTSFFTYDRSEPKFVEAVRHTATLYNDAAFQKGLRQAWPSLANDGLKNLTIKTRSPKASYTLPKDSVVMEIKLDPKSQLFQAMGEGNRQAKKAHTFEFVVASNNERVCMVWGNSNESEDRKPEALTRDCLGLSSSEQLSTQTLLTPLKQEELISGGYSGIIDQLRIGVASGFSELGVADFDAEKALKTIESLDFSNPDAKWNLSRTTMKNNRFRVQTELSKAEVDNIKKLTATAIELFPTSEELSAD